MVEVSLTDAPGASLWAANPGNRRLWSLLRNSPSRGFERQLLSAMSSCRLGLFRQLPDARS